MPRVRFIHWNAEEARDAIARLLAAGYQVDYTPIRSGADLPTLARTPPAAIVIDLTRLPSHGREVALFFRERKATRRVPIVFVEGEPEKIKRIQQVLPDAAYTTWQRIRSDLKRAIAHPPKNPRVPSSILEGYSGTPLPKKLGIGPGSVVALLNAPRDFEKTLGALPEGAIVRRQARGPCHRVLFFTKSQRELKSRLKSLAGLLGKKGGLWIAWPKKASGVATDLSEPDVRRLGLASGLVDYKICAIDATWSGLLFARRRSS